MTFLRGYAATPGYDIAADAACCLDVESQWIHVHQDDVSRSSQLVMTHPSRRTVSGSVEVRLQEELT